MGIVLHDGQIDALFEYVIRRGREEKAFGHWVASMYREKVSDLMVIDHMALTVSRVLRRPNPSSIRYFFLGTKFRQLILELPRRDVCVIGGVRQAAFCIRHGTKFLNNTLLWDLLADGVDGVGCEVELIKDQINSLSFQIGLKAFGRAVLVVDNDSLPMQRAVILAARYNCSSKITLAS